MAEAVDVPCGARAGKRKVTFGNIACKVTSRYPPLYSLHRRPLSVHIWPLLYRHPTTGLTGSRSRPVLARALRTALIGVGVNNELSSQILDTEYRTRLKPLENFNLNQGLQNAGENLNWTRDVQI